MTVKELISVLESFPESWKDNEVLCFHDLNSDVDDSDDEFITHEEKLGNLFKNNNVDYYEHNFMLAPVKNLTRLSMLKTNCNKNLFQLPIDIIILD